MEPIILPHSPNSRVPEAVAPFRHCMPVQARFSDFDMLGHLNNTVYLSYFDTAKAAYFTDVTGGDVDWHNPGVVVVNINIDFFAPVMPGERVEVLTATTRMGEKSFVLEQRIVTADTRETRCMARTVMAGFDTSTMKSMPISDEWRQALNRFEQREL